MNVSVCIAATRPETVGMAVRSIVKQSYRDWELVVLAQGAQAADIARVVREQLNGCDGRVIEQSGRGLSRARNAMVECTSGDLIAMTDDDCEPAPDWLEVLVDRSQSSPHVGLLGGSVVASPRTRRGPGNCPECFPQDVFYEPRSAADPLPDGFWIIGANLAFRRTTATSAGPFDEFLGAGARFPVAEEMDFMRRAANLGITMRGVPEAIVNHTYGWRYGAREVWKLQRSYSRGNGAYAAKKRLLGDPKGLADLKEARRLTALDWWERRAPVALPAGLGRYYYWAAGYRECLRDFVVNDRGLLQKKASQPHVARDGDLVADGDSTLEATAAAATVPGA